MGKRIYNSNMIEIFPKKSKAPFWLQMIMGLAILLIVILIIFHNMEYFQILFPIISVILLLISIFSLIALRKVFQYTQQLKLALNTDRMTGLYSSVYLMEMLDVFVESGDGDLVLIFMDLDELKEYNDKYGHRAGDKLITSAAEGLSEAIAGRGTGYRYGGDEFVGVLNDISLEEGEQIAKRIVKAFEIRDISASIGVCKWEPGMTADSFLHEADRTMYKAKKSGKGGIVVQKDDLPEENE